MEKAKVIIRVEQEVEDCFECPYCMQNTEVLTIDGYCRRGEFNIDDAFSGVAEKCPFRKESRQ